MPERIGSGTSSGSFQSTRLVRTAFRHMPAGLALLPRHPGQEEPAEVCARCVSPGCRGGSCHRPQTSAGLKNSAEQLRCDLGGDAVCMAWRVRYPVDNPTLEQMQADPSRSGRSLTARQESARADDTGSDPDVTDTRGRTQPDNATECTCHIGKYLS